MSRRHRVWDLVHVAVFKIVVRMVDFVEAKSFPLALLPNLRLEHMNAFAWLRETRSELGSSCDRTPCRLRGRSGTRASPKLGRLHALNFSVLSVETSDTARNKTSLLRHHLCIVSRWVHQTSILVSFALAITLFVLCNLLNALLESLLHHVLIR